MKILHATSPVLLGEIDQLIMKETNPEKIVNHLLNHHNLQAYGRPMMSIPKNRLVLEENEAFTPTKNAKEALQQVLQQVNEPNSTNSGAIYLFRNTAGNQSNNIPDVYGILDISRKDIHNYLNQ